MLRRRPALPALVGFLVVSALASVSLAGPSSAADTSSRGVTAMQWREMSALDDLCGSRNSVLLGIALTINCYDWHDVNVITGEARSGAWEPGPTDYDWIPLEIRYRPTFKRVPQGGARYISVSGSSKGTVAWDCTPSAVSMNTARTDILFFYDILVSNAVTGSPILRTYTPAKVECNKKTVSYGSIGLDLETGGWRGTPVGVNGRLNFDFRTGQGEDSWSSRAAADSRRFIPSGTQLRIQSRLIVMPMAHFTAFDVKLLKFPKSNSVKVTLK